MRKEYLCKKNKFDREQGKVLSQGKIYVNIAGAYNFLEFVFTGDNGKPVAMQNKDEFNIYFSEKI